MSFDNLRGKYINNDIIQIQESSTNILDQLPSYNSYQNNAFIRSLNIEYDEQCSLNKMLLSDDINNKSEKIKEFVSTQSDNVNNELESLEKIVNDLKQTCRENKNLESDKEELQELINSPECNEIANKMRKIKSLKTDILLFLDQMGLRVQNF
jgi:gamma-glutamyl:cysteine ligase YbdK (ATP-grasp superfamily)